MKNIKMLSIIIFIILLVSDIVNAFPAFEDEQIAFSNWFFAQPTSTQILVVIGLIALIIWLTALMKSKTQKFILAAIFSAIFYGIALGYSLILDKMIDGDVFIWNAFFGFGFGGVLLGFAILIFIGFYWGAELGLYKSIE